jgi:hypothetical protein
VPARLHIATPPPVAAAPSPFPAPAGVPAPGAEPGGRLAPTTTAAAPAEAPMPVSQLAPEGDQTPPELDIDDIARRVYGQVRTQLRSELLIDRERAGLLTDFR